MSIEENAHALLDDLAGRRRHCSRIIRELAKFYGLDPRPWLEDGHDVVLDEVHAHSSRRLLEALAQSSGRTDTKPPERETPLPPREPKPGAPDPKPPERETPPPGRHRGPTTAPSGQQILTALQAKPLSPGDLARVLHVTVKTLRKKLQPLILAKRIILSGTTNGRRIALTAAPRVPRAN